MLVLKVLLPSCLALTQHQIQGSFNIKTLLDTAADCLRFVTEFFEVISQSAPHIYHSALFLTPRSSIVWKLYGQHICSPMLKVITGMPALWDSCTASVGATMGVGHVVWSPYGQFIAVDIEEIIEVRDSSTLERVSVFKPPGPLSDHIPRSLAFSPNGCLLACHYV